MLVFEVIVNKQGVLLCACFLYEHLIQRVPIGAFLTHLSDLIKSPEILILENVALPEIKDGEII